MATGLSLHVGLNSVDPDRYGGWDGQLNACENDARDMARIATAAGFRPTVLLTGEGTAEAITTELRKAAQNLQDGDILLFSYSGHGGQVANTTGTDQEADDRDETLVFYDREFLDDELNREFARCADGVRILTFLDSCHSGTAAEVVGDEADGTPRLMPPDKQLEIYERDREFFQRLQRELRDRSEDERAADGLLISACRDDQVAMDGAVNGKFTETLLKVWDDGAFTDDYRAFHQGILSRMPRSQTPEFFPFGSPAEGFLGQRPFTV